MNGKVGVFGGTFNPIHVGHLEVAREALRQFGLSQVVFVPTGRPPHKPVVGGISGELRYEMVRRAVADCPEFTVSRIELEMDGPAYTVYTVGALNKVYPQGIAYLVGADIFHKIDEWKDYDTLVASCPFIVAPREGIAPEAFRQPPFDKAELYFLQMDEVRVSSREIREKYRDGESPEGLVPAAVDAFIRERGLYGVAQAGRVG
ncbi:MAG: nicotinate-nucleotide adenylyltransferase [Candidatus Bipolaricaulota bacterium]